MIEEGKGKMEYLLTLEQVSSLFEYVGAMLEDAPCDHSLRFTQQWIEENVPQEQQEAVQEEIEEMGGFCDCEVMMNCYEEYLEELYPDDKE